MFTALEPILRSRCWRRMWRHSDRCLPGWERMADIGTTEEAQ